MRTRPIHLVPTFVAISAVAIGLLGTAVRSDFDAEQSSIDARLADGDIDPGLHLTLANSLSGTFSSRSQAMADPAFYDVKLRTTGIWGGQGRSEGPWLYVEQAMAAHRDRPYRQRVYRLRFDRDRVGVRSTVYTLPGPERFIGGWDRTHLFDGLSPDSLSLREGCDIHLTFTGDAFEGSTRGNDCGSSLRGATYATSEVRVEANRITSWDRGFDANGEQVWGAVSGPYQFERMSSKPYIER